LLPAVVDAFRGDTAELKNEEEFAEDEEDDADDPTGERIGDKDDAIDDVLLVMTEASATKKLSN
jgi:hypothetical protein